MRELIACCGINCENCEARVATLKNDDAMRKEVAAKWSEMFHAPVTPEMINCTGCRMPGLKFSHCENTCEIRKCALSKGFTSCADCADIDGCDIVGSLFKALPEARENLRMLMN